MTIAKTTIPIRGVAAGADGMAEFADSKVAGALAQLKAVRAARAATMAREVGRLETSGSEYAPRIQVLKARLGNDIAYADEAEFAALRATSDYPVSGPRQWSLYGLVFHDAGKPAKNHQLIVSDQHSGKKLGDAFVDANGRFSLRLDVAAPEDEATGDSPAGRTARLQVFDAGGELAYSADDEVEVKAGNVEYRELLIPESAAGRVTRKKTSRKKSQSKKKKR